METDKMRLLRRLFLVTMAAVTIGACAQPAPAPPPPPDTKADEAKLRADLTKWMADINAGNIDAAAAQYASDAVLMPPNMPASAGTAAIRTTLTNIQGEMKTVGLTLAVTGTPTVMVQGDMAWISGTYAVNDAKGATLDVGKFVSVHRRAGAAWPYVRDIWNSDNPPPPPPPPAKKGK